MLFALTVLLLLPAAATADGASLADGERLNLDTCLSSGEYHVCLRKTGLQVHSGPDANTAKSLMWSSPKVKNAAAAAIQGGSLVLLDAKGATLWFTESAEGDRLVLQPDGVLTLVDEGWVSNSVVWSTDGSAASPSMPVAAASVIKEPATGVKFDRTATFAGSSGSFHLLGAGVRAKAIVGPIAVNVYAVGLYVPVAEASKALANYAGKDNTGVRSYFAAIGTIHRMWLHLVFVRSVGSQKVVDSLTALSGVSPAALEAFSSMLLKAMGSSVSSGQTISLGIDGGNLLVNFDGKRVGEVRGSVLAKAVYNLYLGPDAVSPSAKAAFAAGLPGLLAAS